MQRSRLLALSLGLAALGAGMLGTGCGSNNVTNPNTPFIGNFNAINQTPTINQRSISVIPSATQITSVVANLTNPNFVFNTAGTSTAGVGANSLAGDSFNAGLANNAQTTVVYAVNNGSITPITVNETTGGLTQGATVAAAFTGGNASVLFQDAELVIADSKGNLVGVPVNGNVVDPVATDATTLVFPGVTSLSVDNNEGVVYAANGAVTTPVVVTQGNGKAGTPKFVFTAGKGISISGGKDLVTASTELRDPNTNNIFPLQISAAPGVGGIFVGDASTNITNGVVSFINADIANVSAGFVGIPAAGGNVVTPTAITVVAVPVGSNLQNNLLPQQVQLFAVIGTSAPNGLGANNLQADNIIVVPIDGATGTLNFTGGGQFSTPDGLPVDGLGAATSFTSSFTSSNNNNNFNTDNLFTVVTAAGPGSPQDAFQFTLNTQGNPILIDSNLQGQLTTFGLGNEAASGNGNPVVISAQQP